MPGDHYIIPSACNLELPEIDNINQDLEAQSEEEVVTINLPQSSPQCTCAIKPTEDVQIR